MAHLKFYNTLSFRLSCIVTFVAMLTFVPLVYTIDKKVKANLDKESVLRTQNSIDVIASKIEAIIAHAEIVAKNAEWSIIDKNGNFNNIQDSLSSVPYNIVKNNDCIGGAVISLIPNSVPQLGEKYASLCYEDSNKKIIQTVLNYDYTKEEWWQNPIREKSDRWSEPFFATNMHEMVTSYSHVIYNKNTNKPIALLTVDLKLSELKDMIKAHLPYPQSKAFLISHEGNYIVHPSNKYLLKKSLLSIDSVKRDNPFRDTIGEVIKVNNFRANSLSEDDEEYQMFYYPILSTKWSLAIACPYSDVYSKSKDAVIGLSKIFLICLSILMVFCFIVSHFATRPLRQFSETLRKVGDGEYDIELPKARGGSELHQFRESFTQMQSSLKENIKRLTETTKEQERLNSELHIAKSIQESLLSKDFSPYAECPNLELFAELKPALEVGGDLYDFFIRDKKLFFAIGDVSGKGIPASLFMAITRGLFRILAYSENSPGIIASRINQTLAADNKENMFVTMFIGILDLETGVLSMTNAGHNPPLLIHSDRDGEYLKALINLPIGVVDDTQYKDEEIKLKEGDGLLLYTDGITEAENCNNELYGENRLFNEVAANSRLDAKGIIEKVHESVNIFVGDNVQSDDITMLCLKLGNLAK